MPDKKSSGPSSGMDDSLCRAKVQRTYRQVNIPDEFLSAVRRYKNHFLDSLLCILNHNFYKDICKGCYAPQMRQGFDKYSHRNRKYS